MQGSPSASHNLYLGVKNFHLHFLLVTDDLNVFLAWRAFLIAESAMEILTCFRFHYI